MVARKGESVAVPWLEHNTLFSQPYTQGEFHQGNFALSLF